jgi:hypothetical protein
MGKEQHIGYVIMYGYGEDHHIVMHIFENKYGNNEPFKGRFKRNL